MRARLMIASAMLLPTLAFAQTSAPVAQPPANAVPAKPIPVLQPPAAPAPTAPSPQMADSHGHEPFSTKASNILPGDTHTSYAPSLPAPDVGADASPRTLLTSAQHALAARQTGLAQQALEMAETRLLDRSLLPENASKPDASPLIAQISMALQALGQGDTGKADTIISRALADTSWTT